MSSLGQHMELQFRESIKESLLNEFSIYNQEEYRKELSEIMLNEKQFQNKAKLAMEEREEKEQQQSQLYIQRRFVNYIVIVQRKYNRNQIYCINYQF
ncbi:unnamed protein product [Paramecium octaurelia]|uniref:Uncharacterized protein n=1 Tax=Paramecium octaurelia TaxID=43137 RepID=A0A8S1U026_PAROT|nr:unnamed protein product [Paramecium octaurelia]